MKEISYKDLQINPFNLIGDVWMLVTAGSPETGCNTMTASWGHLGSASGRDEDKIARTGLTPVYADNTVYFAEAKLVLVCKKVYRSELREDGFLDQAIIEEHYPLRDYHTMYVGRIEKVLTDGDAFSAERC